MNRLAHASSFVWITHSHQRVVCTLSLGSKSRTTVPRVGETELITTSHVAFHTRLTHFPYHILIVSIAPLFHLQQFQNQYLFPGIIPRPYIIAAKHIQQEQL